MIYLDYAATTPIDESVLDVYVKASQKYFGNASSLHDIGSEANELLKISRQQFAKLINGEEDSIYFTSGGSESNILAIRSLIEGCKGRGNHLITTEVEHSSIYNLFKQLEQEGYEVTYLPINSSGEINVSQLKKSINENTILASIHHGNSEIGAVQDIKLIGHILKSHHVIFHTDCVQTFGKLPIDVAGCHIDSLSISSHKIYGPKGVGACYINPQLVWVPQQKGTTHERGLRPGTVDVPGILAFLSAAQLIVNEMEHNENKYDKLRSYFLNKISQLNYDITVYGHPNKQLSSIVGLTISGIQGQYVMLECNRSGLAISTGSACQVGQQSPSRTMLSIGKNEDEAKQLIRISFGKQTNKSDIDKVIDTLRKIVEKI